MLELQVEVHGDESEVLLATLLKGAHPPSCLREPNHFLVFLDAQVPLFQRVEIAQDTVHFEILRLVELLEELFCDLHCIR